MVRGGEEPARWHRIDAARAPGALESIANAPDVSAVCAVLADDMDHDEFVALVSVLVMRGVGAFETTRTQSVKRVLDMYLAISDSELEISTP